jgi:hypothetical protein
MDIVNIEVTYSKEIVTFWAIKRHDFYLNGAVITMALLADVMGQARTQAILPEGRSRGWWTTLLSVGLRNDEGNLRCGGRGHSGPAPLCGSTHSYTVIPVDTHILVAFRQRVLCFNNVSLGHGHVPNAPVNGLSSYV